MSEPAAAAPAPDVTPAPDTGTPAPAPDVTPAQEPTPNSFEALPDNWRTDLVSLGGYEGDEATKRVGQLERVLDMGTLTKNYFSAQDRIRNGELSNGLPDDPTPEQLAEWREANGVPEAPDKYELALDDGLILGEDDTRIMAGVYEVAHAENVSAKTMSALTNAMLKGRELEQEALEQADGVQSQQVTAQLKSAWGSDFTTNRNMVAGLMAQLPESIKEDFLQARMPDGRAVFNSPEMMQFFADTARKLNPAGTVVPNANNPAEAINDEIAKLEARMGEDSSAWHKDQASQDRLMALYNAREGMKA